MFMDGILNLKSQGYLPNYLRDLIIVSRVPPHESQKNRKFNPSPYPPWLQINGRSRYTNSSTQLPELDTSKFGLHNVYSRSRGKVSVLAPPVILLGVSLLTEPKNRVT